MKNKNKIIWGVLLIAAGVLFLLKALNILTFDLFFDGWWTLFLIVPGVIGLFTDGDKTDNIICILIGVILLLGCQGILSFGLIWKLFLPIVIIIAGVKLLFGGFSSGKAREVAERMKLSGAKGRSGFAAFSGQDMNFDGETFEGAELDAIFGGIKCDLRGAVIDQDAVIRVSAIFGGIDILVPPNVVVKSSVTGIFGGVSNKASRGQKDAPVLYVTGLCMFGGVEIK